MNWLIEPRQQIDTPLNCGVAFGIIIFCAGLTSDKMCKSLCFFETDLCVGLFTYAGE